MAVPQAVRYAGEKMVEKPINNETSPIYIKGGTLLFLLFFVLVSSHQPFLFTLKVLQEVNLYRREVVLGTLLEFVVFLVGLLFEISNTLR